MNTQYDHIDDTSQQLPPAIIKPRRLGLTIAIGVALLAAACTSTLGLARVVQQVTATASPSASAQSDTSAALQAALQRANEEQQQAFNQNDPQLMADTATAAHYAELVQTNTDLRNSGVTAIELVSISFNQVTAGNATAQATTRETWRATYADGSTVDATTQNDYTLVLDAGAWKVQSDVQPAGQVDPSTTPGQPATAEAIGSTSQNWSGYVASGGTFTAVTGTWIVPAVSSASAGADATWVGIGGASSTDLLQAGTQAVVSGGTVQYEAWIEMLPQPSQTVPLTIAAGDTVTVTLTQQSGATWAISIDDQSSAQTYRTTVSYASTLSSAEWIEEAPSAGRGIVPLSQFGTLRFVAGSTLLDGKTVSLLDAAATAITMVDRFGQVLATPSPLAADGSSFTIART